jgi:hypothetical protein
MPKLLQRQNGAVRGHTDGKFKICMYRWRPIPGVTRNVRRFLQDLTSHHARPCIVALRVTNPRRHPCLTHAVFEGEIEDVAASIYHCRAFSFTHEYCEGTIEARRRATSSSTSLDRPYE